MMFASKPVIVVIKSRQIQQYDNAFNGFKNTLDSNRIAVSYVMFDIKGSREEGLKIIEKISVSKPALILSIGTLATEIAKEKITKIPILFCMVLNPVADKLIESIVCSGNNLTGASMDIPTKQQFETLKSILPDLTSIGVLYNPKETSTIIKDAEKTAKEMGIEFKSKPINSEIEIPKALDQIYNKKIDCLWSVSDGTVFSSLKSIQFIILFSLRNKIPFMGLSSSFVKSGALIAISCDSEDNGCQAGELAIELLKGTKPSKIPITTPRKVYLSINKKIAETIGIKIHPEVIKKAKEVY